MLKFGRPTKLAIKKLQLKKGAESTKLKADTKALRFWLRFTNPIFEYDE
jgi:hypothetical protein